MENNKIAELEERIKILEEKLDKINFSEAKEINMTNCPIGVITTGTCKLNVQNGSIGTVFEGIDSDIDEAEERLDELEGRLDEINDGIDEAESKLDELEK